MKRILDTCCGRKLEVNPDVTADFRSIPFEDNSLVTVYEMKGAVKMEKSKLIAKHAKKFTSTEISSPVLRGIHYAADGSVYATNRHYALRIRNAHNCGSPITIHAKEDRPIEGDYPKNIHQFFIDSLRVNNCIQFSLGSALEHARHIANIAADLAAKLDREVPVVKLDIANGVGRLILNAPDKNLYFSGFFGNADSLDSSKRWLNPKYLFNALTVFQDAGSATVKIKLRKPNDVILLTDENDIDIVISPIRTPESE